MRRIAATIALAALTFAGAARADDWPTKPITLVVPFSAGGPIDTLARILSPGLAEALGQQIVIEDIGGAGGMMGDARIARAAPDGYTFGVGNQGTHIFSQYLYRKPLYDPYKDFAPIGLVVGNSRVVIARKNLPANTLPEFIAYAKKHEAEMQYGSGGAGSGTHMACVLFTHKMGTPKVTHVPYRGTSLAMQDLIAGRIDYLCDITSTALPQILGGRVKPIAVLRDTRSPVLPDVPTALEQGLAGVEADGWNAFFAPTGTPPAIIAKLNAATSKAMDDPATRKVLEHLGLEIPRPEERTPDYLTKLVRSEMSKWGPPIEAAGFGKK